LRALPPDLGAASIEGGIRGRTLMLPGPLSDAGNRMVRYRAVMKITAFA